MSTKVIPKLCSGGKTKNRRECVQADVLGGKVTDDGRKGKEQSAHESFVGHAKGYELYFGCFGEPLKDF